MRPTLTHLLTLSAIVALAACAKETAPAPSQAAPVEAAKPAKTEAGAPANEESPAGQNPSIDSKTNVAAPTTADQALDSEAKAKLAKVYTEIYCAQRRGESEKLLDIYSKNGFEDPETWTKTWTKAAEDGAWVAKTTHDAIRACGDQSPPTP
jgi:hypothetical protein